MLADTWSYGAAQNQYLSLYLFTRGLLNKLSNGRMNSSKLQMM
jgi:hypothetical protein